MSYSFIFIYYVSQRFLPSRKEGFRVSQKFVGVGPSRSCSLQNKGYNKKMQEDTYVRAVHRWSRAPSEHLTPPQEQRRGVQTPRVSLTETAQTATKFGLQFCLRWTNKDCFVSFCSRLLFLFCFGS